MALSLARLENIRPESVEEPAPAQGALSALFRKAEPKPPAPVFRTSRGQVFGSVKPA